MRQMLERVDQIELVKYSDMILYQKMQRLKGACRFRINETYYVDDIAAFFHFHLRRDLNIGLLSSKALPPSDYFMILRLEQEHVNCWLQPRTLEFELQSTDKDKDITS